MFHHGGATSATCELYMPHCDSWWPWVADMPLPRDNHGGVALADGRYVAVGGRVRPGGYTATCCQFTLEGHRYGPMPDGDPRKRTQLEAVQSGERTIVSSFVRSFVRSFVCSFVRSFVRSFVLIGGLPPPRPFKQRLGLPKVSESP